MVGEKELPYEKMQAMWNLSGNLQAAGNTWPARNRSVIVWMAGHTEIISSNAVEKSLRGIAFSSHRFDGIDGMPQPFYRSGLLSAF